MKPTSGPPGPRRPWSRVCCTAIGTTTWPSDATHREEQGAGRCPPAARASTRRRAGWSPGRRCRRRCPSGCRRCARSAGQSVAHVASTSAVLLVGVDEVGVRRAARRAARRGCRGRRSGRPRGRPPRRPARSSPCGRRPRPASAAGRRAAAQGLEDPGLDLGVDRRGGVVEDQQPRPADQRAGQRDPLPLPAGQRGAALAELGVEAVAAGRRRSRRPGRCAAPPRPPRRGRRRRA